MNNRLIKSRFHHRHLIAVILLSWAWCGASACTSAIAGAAATANHRMLLWKHRDSGHPHNFVARVDATDSITGQPLLSFVGLFNAGDTHMREVWAGMNEAGLGIMNTASYNLAPDTATIKDREGLIMAEALQRCSSAAEFLALLDGKLSTGQPLGVQANFGVIDAGGTGLYIETSDHHYTVYSLTDESQPLMIRSNYSYSGGNDNRLGEVRHDNAAELLTQPLNRRDITPATFIDTLSQSFLNTREGRDMLAGTTRWIEDRGEMIPRWSSCASVVIEGGTPDTPPVMWVALGWPLLAETVKVTLSDIRPDLLPSAAGHRSPLCNKAVRLRDKLMPRKNSRCKRMFDANKIRKEILNRKSTLTSNTATR